jgi:tRNA threonylcarbamoyladenosine modification (KEOPS) complex Cgi121 subunit
MTQERGDPLADEVDVPVRVAGARGSFRRGALVGSLAAAAEDREATVQALAPPAVYGAEHARAAARRAWRAHRDGRSIARDLGVEVACYAAGVDQIDEALATVGVPETGEAVVLCSVGPDAEAGLAAALERADLARDDEVLAREAAALERLGVDAEAATGGDPWPAVLEHVALLDART